MTVCIVVHDNGESSRQQRRKLRLPKDTRIAGVTSTKDIVTSMMMIVNRWTMSRRAVSVPSVVSLILLLLLLLLPAFDAYVVVPNVSLPVTSNSSTRHQQLHQSRRRHHHHHRRQRQEEPPLPPQQPWNISTRYPSCPVRLQSSSSNTDEDRHHNDSNNYNNKGNDDDPLERMSAEDVRGRPSGVVMKDLDWRLMRLKLEEENTRRFLKAGPRFLPYDESRKWVQAWGQRWTSEQDWNYWIESGEKRNSYIPSRPEEYYTKRGSWISWVRTLCFKKEKKKSPRIHLYVFLELLM